MQQPSLLTHLPQANVLVDKSGNARLTDYGLALINSNANLTVASPTIENSRWLAPEITNPHDTSDIVVESKPADVYAFGMLAIEVFTGKLPFEGCSGSETALRIRQGHRPEFPQNADNFGPTVQMREFLQRCWHRDPARRPAIDEVVRTLEILLRNNDHVQGASSDQNRGEPVTPADDLPNTPVPTPSLPGGGRPIRTGKNLLSSLDITNSPT